MHLLTQLKKWVHTKNILENFQGVFQNMQLHSNQRQRTKTDATV